MASVEAASALLTAESIVVAGMALTLQNAEIPVERVTVKIGLIAAGFSLAVSFVVSLIYLHVAEFPERMFANFYSPDFLLALALFLLLAAVYFGFGGMYLEFLAPKSEN